MQRRALLIGSPLGGLEGVSADLSAMAEALAAWKLQIQTLTGASASREGILAAYEQLIEDTEPGDAAVVYYSGHGGYTDDRSAAAGMAATFHQFIMPTDFYSVHPASGEFRGIMSVELSHLQAQLTKKTDNVISIFDCCHSARMCRGDLSRPRGLQAVEWTAVVDAFAKRLRDEGRVADARLLAGNPNAVRLLACGQEQQAFEPRGGNPGFFTGELVAALRAAVDTPWITWRQLMQRVRDRVLARVPSQHPELEGPGRRKLFDTATADLTGVLSLGELGRTKVLRGGAIMGVEVGDEYLVMKAGESEAAEERAVARAMVVGVGLGPLSWPDEAPRDMERRESLLVIVTREPHDFSGLEGAGASRGKGVRSGLEGMIDWIDRGGTRDLTRAATASSYHFAVEHIELLVTPEGLPAR